MGPQLRWRLPLRRWTAPDAGRGENEVPEAGKFTDLLRGTYDGAAGDELAIKRTWWKQVFAPGHARTLPWLKMVNWFEWRKHEPEVGGTVDWTATRSTKVRSSFLSALPAWLRYAH